MRQLMKKVLLLSLSLSLFSAQSFAFDAKDWKLRLRGLAIVPDDSSTTTVLNNTTGQGSGVTVDNNLVPEIDITYMLSSHWGIEVIAGVSNHDISVDGTSTATLAALGVTDGTKLFDTWVLPPTVTFQYHFLPENTFRPYLGAGINYTAFLADNATTTAETAFGGGIKVSTENVWGYAIQAGMDYDISESWYLNLDVKYIDIDTSAKLGVTSGALAGNVLNVDVDVDPWIVGIGIGYRF